MKKTRSFLLAASVSLALAFTISCEGGNNPSSLVGQWELASPSAKGKDDNRTNTGANLSSPVFPRVWRGEPTGKEY